MRTNCLHIDIVKGEFIFCLGVFYIVYGGCTLSIFILIGEWITAAYDAIDTNDTSVSQVNRIHFLFIYSNPLSQNLFDSIAEIKYLIPIFQKPQSMKEALCKQFRNLRDDFLDDWVPQFPAFFPCCKQRTTKEQKQLENAKETLQISSIRELATLSRVAGALKKVLDTDKQSSLVNSLPMVDLPKDTRTDKVLNNMRHKGSTLPIGSPWYNGSPRPRESPRESLSTPLSFQMNGSPRSSISSVNYLSPAISEPPSPGATVPDLLY